MCPANSDAKSTPKQLTDGKFDEEEPTFTPDGKQHCVPHRPQSRAVLRTPKTEIMSVPSTGRNADDDCENRHGRIGGMVLSPDGKAARVSSAPCEQAGPLVRAARSLGAD